MSYEYSTKHMWDEPAQGDLINDHTDARKMFLDMSGRFGDYDVDAFIDTPMGQKFVENVWVDFLRYSDEMHPEV